MGRVASVALAGIAAVVLAPAVAAQSAPRSVVPIREVDIRPIGTPRYAIEVVVNGTPMLAGLDTGSTGLRLLPRAAALARIAPGGEPERYDYGSGVLLDGHQARADVAIGGARSMVTVQAVDRVGCNARKPDCPASHLAPADYGLMGSGQAGQGFPAIIGIRLDAGRVGNPLPRMGVHRWIVHLPQRGGGGGTLILNPDARDTAGFVPLRAGAANAHGTVAGCVALALPGARQACGPTLFDTGAPGITVLHADRPPAWQPGRRARLLLDPAQGGRSPVVGFVTGDQAHGANTSFQPEAGSQTVVHAGTLPFYAFDVLFDADSTMIAVRPNPDAGPSTVPLSN
ncbi:hypothetical protein FHT00_002895 [Sphingomonas insulae]|uniref:Aspartyl protease n=2 Tax=Sphingomonas insulae TaxID=424800 RepID=A0ABN1HN89_9SPHN|nr:hypothetical protein [Sphingomonas insulae]NIJ30922.1 hypothetical protein [Sphingomonas insulae]